MYVNLILSKLPNEKQFKQTFKGLGFDDCFIIKDENDWLNVPKNDNIACIYNTSPYRHKKWQYYIDIGISDKVVNNEKWLYFSIAKKIGELTPCDILCNYYDNDIINGNIHNDPYYDFAFIDNGWYLIDDVDLFYDNDLQEEDESKGDIIIVKSIDKEMAYFLKFGEYLDNTLPSKQS